MSMTILVDHHGHKRNSVRGWSENFVFQDTYSRRGGGHATMRSVNYIVLGDHIQSATFLILFMFVLHDTSSCPSADSQQQCRCFPTRAIHHLSTCYVGGRYSVPLQIHFVLTCTWRWLHPPTRLIWRQCYLSTIIPTSSTVSQTIPQSTARVLMRKILTSTSRLAELGSPANLEPAKI